MDEKVRLMPLVKFLISRGKLKSAIEKIIGFLENNDDKLFQEIRDDLILMLCQFESLEGKLLKGIISFKEAETKENRIMASSLKLINDFEKLSSLVKLDNKPLEIQNSERSIIGTWKCNEVSPSSGNENQIIWIIKSDVHSSMYFDIDTGKLRKRTPKKKYKFENGINITEQKNGKITKGLVEWVSEDKFIYTIIEGVMKHLAGHKRIYTRIG